MFPFDIMGEILDTYRVTLICGVIFRAGTDLDALQERLVAEFGPVSARSQVVPFDLTGYYEKEMGTNLSKIFFVFENLIEQEAIVDIKLKTNDIEMEIAQKEGCPENRPVNLDPGYVTLGKLVLATTKDNYHRVYLGRGIYAEVTLQFRYKTFKPFEWSYPDYKKDEYIQFFNGIRNGLRDRMRKKSG